MTTQTEDLLWIAAQEGKIIHRDIVSFAEKQNKTLYDIFKMEVDDFLGIEKKNITKFITKRENIQFPKFQEIYDQVQKDCINIIKFPDSSFPPRLKQLTDPNLPIMLYHQGLKIPFQNCIAVVGTRNCSTYSFEIARDLGRGLAKLGYVVVAGLARGIDAASHRGAISVNGQTIAVLPWFINPYPKEHEQLIEEIKKHGCIISENFTSASQYDKFKFLERNAVISGISEILIAVESSYSGGTRWQVDLALDQGKKVIAVEPEKSNKLSYDGYEKFVQKGAIGMNSIDQILEYVIKNAPLVSAKNENNIDDEYGEITINPIKTK